MPTFTSTDPAKPLIMKTISYTLLFVTIVGGSTAHAQLSRFYISERNAYSNFAALCQQSPHSLTQFQVKIPCKRNGLAFRLKGTFKIKREYSSPEDFKEVKYFLVSIHPYRIHVKPKQKFI
jgi:hypothetical protein